MMLNFVFPFSTEYGVSSSILDTSDIHGYDFVVHKFNNNTAVLKL